MAKPRKKHTVESLLARCEEVGDCLEWTGYIANGNPQVCMDGKITTVRRAIKLLSGENIRGKYYFYARCGNPSCVSPEHIGKRTATQHYKAMAESDNRNERLRRMRIQAAKKATSKITAAMAGEIRLATDSQRVLAEKYGVSKSLISKIKRNSVWVDFSNPFMR